MIPIARWKGYGGESNPNGSSFESIAWACGLLAATRRISVFCTVVHRTGLSDADQQEQIRRAGLEFSEILRRISIQSR